MAKYECKISTFNHVLITAPKMIGSFELRFTKDYTAHLYYFDNQDRNHLIGQYFGLISKKYEDDFLRLDWSFYVNKTIQDSPTIKRQIFDCVVFVSSVLCIISDADLFNQINPASLFKWSYNDI